ncbi:unnamed protein product [Orchesella dallaii]|uniref:Protein quiver n=1 Tax=Orchesella dallaii TaxID=48710 RepID=A0ABP1PSA8_9HEXA
MKGAIVLVALCLVVTFADGLKCYNCAYLDDDLPAGLSYPVPSESSCKLGKKPDSKLLVDCSQIIYSRSATNETGALSVLAQVLGEDHPLTVDPMQANYTYTYTCVSLSYDGNFQQAYSGSEMQAMFRSCLRKYAPANSTFQEQCHAGRMDRVNITDPDVRDAAFSLTIGPFMNQSRTDVSICTCNKDNCNSALVSTPISFFVVASSLVAILLKQM